MQPKKIEELLEKYTNGTANANERALVETWYLKHEPTLNFVPNSQLEEDKKQSLKSLLTEIDQKRPRKIWISIAAAASILAVLGTSVYYLTLPKKQQINYAAQNANKIALPPGGNKATLTLANGNVIVLNGAKNGTLANQGNTKINKTGEGVINYANSKNANSSGTLVYNIASTPRGGQYQLVLADGTKVWLNAASSIKFPVEFLGNERKVEITGEAYFEVAHDANKPFRVAANGQTVEDLGTHFNINAYSDEAAVKTTLLEGSVRVTAGGENKVIKPGEQVQLKNGGLNVASVDVDEVVAWKNGFFHFEDNSIQEVARQLSRWYDVDIKFEGQLSPRLFSGEISRNVDASQILDILSFKKIHYRIEGKSIVIQP